MPKETIAYPLVEYGPEGDDGWPTTKTTTGSHIAVCWGRDDDITLKDPAGVSLHTRFYGDGTDPGFDHIFSLSRKQVNGLIRVLRKARDQAFGRDE